MVEQAPSYALAMSTVDASSLQVSGWRHRIAAWEGALNESASQASPAPFEGAKLYGKPIEIADAELIEFECTYSGGLGAHELEILTVIVGEDIAQLIDGDLVTLGDLPISANRDSEPSAALAAFGAKQVDFLLCTLPSRRGDVDGTAWHCARWARIILVRNSILIFFAEPEGNWPPPAERWHHSGLPSRAARWHDERSRNLPITLEDALASYVDDLLRHQLYFLRSWPGELELWERKAFESLGRADSSINVAKLASLEIQLGHLGDYLNNARTSLRNFERKSETSRLIQSQPTIGNLLSDHVRDAEPALQSARSQLRRSVALLSDVASLSSLKAAELQRLNSERSQTFITLLTVFFIVPSAVIGVYGSNISELSPGMYGDLAGLGIWLGGSISATIGVVRIIAAESNRDQGLPRWHWWTGGVIASATVVCTVWTGSPMNIVATSVFITASASLFAIAALQVRRRRAPALGVPS